MKKELLPIYILASIATGLLIYGAIVPPPGVVDASLVQSAGELIGLVAVVGFFQTVWKAMDEGKIFSIKKGDLSATVHKEE